jgi:hypothetical protein
MTETLKNLWREYCSAEQDYMSAKREMTYAERRFFDARKTAMDSNMGDWEEFMQWRRERGPDLLGEGPP